MNDDIISRQAAIDALVKYTHITWEHLKIIYPMLNVFENLPSAERHGRWIKVNDDDSMYRCSACGELSCCNSLYCGDCGAKMEEECENESR